MLFCGHNITDRKGEEIPGTFYLKELQKNKSKIIQDRKIEKKGDKLYRNSPAFFWSFFDIIHSI